MLCGRAMDGLTTRVFRRPRKCSSRAEAHILVMWPRFAAQLALMRAVMHRERGGARREGRGEGRKKERTSDRLGPQPIA